MVEFSRPGQAPTPPCSTTTCSRQPHPSPQGQRFGSFPRQWGLLPVQPSRHAGPPTRLAATNGVFVTTQPLDVKGPSVKLQLDGTLDMVTQQIDAKLYVTLPVSNTVVLGALAVGAPVVAGAIFAVDKLADKMFGVSTSSLTRVQYQVKGPMDNPNINFFKR